MPSATRPSPAHTTASSSSSRSCCVAGSALYRTKVRSARGSQRETLGTPPLRPMLNSISPSRRSCRRATTRCSPTCESSISASAPPGLSDTLNEAITETNESRAGVGILGCGRRCSPRSGSRAGPSPGRWAAGGARHPATRRYGRDAPLRFQLEPLGHLDFPAHVAAASRGWVVPGPPRLTACTHGLYWQPR